MSEPNETEVMIARVWPDDGMPEALAPSGWTQFGTLEDGSILCRLIHHGTWTLLADTYSVLTSFRVNP